MMFWNSALVTFLTEIFEASTLYTFLLIALKPKKAITTSSGLSISVIASPSPHADKNKPMKISAANFDLWKKEYSQLNFELHFLHK